MSEVCDSGIYSGCSPRPGYISDKSNRRFEIVIPTAPEAELADEATASINSSGSNRNKRVAILGFYIHQKHWLTYKSNCSGLTAPRALESCRKRVCWDAASVCVCVCVCVCTMNVCVWSAVLHGFSLHSGERGKVQGARGGGGGGGAEDDRDPIRPRLGKKKGRGAGQ